MTGPDDTGVSPVERPPGAVTLTLLDAVVERYGPGTVADPVALAAALRTMTDPPPDHEVAVLAEVAATDALPALRASLERDTDPERAVAAATAAAGHPDRPGDDRWAVAHLGAALGLLPRALAAGAERPAAPTTLHPVGPTEELTGGRATTPGPPSTTSPRRRTRFLVAAAVVVLLVAVGALVVLNRGTATPVAAAGVAPPPATTDPGAATPSPAPTTTPEAEAPPADPRSVIKDPGLRAFIEPFLTEPGARCTSDDAPEVNSQEKVSCVFANGNGGVFEKMLSGDVMRDLRAGFLGGTQAAPGTIVRSLRWKYVPDRPGARTGIPPTSRETGNGTRIRFVHESGMALLYFDDDTTHCIGMLGLPESTGDPQADLDVLRAYWADPGR